MSRVPFIHKNQTGYFKADLWIRQITNIENQPNNILDYLFLQYYYYSDHYINCVFLLSFFIQIVNVFFSVKKLFFTQNYMVFLLKCTDIPL